MRPAPAPRLGTAAPSLGCVLAPSLPLQVLLGAHRDWAGLPVAVLEAERLQARVLQVNGPARAAGVLPGTTWAAARALCADLRAAPVPSVDLRRAVARIAETLHVLAPRVEPSREEPGLFWVGVEGLVPLRPSLQSWAGAVRAALAGEGFVVRVAAGFTRFGVYAATRSGRTTEVFHDPLREREEARRVPLALLRAGAGFLEAMDLLGVRTVGDLLALPAAGLEARFGPEAAALRRFAAADLPDPLEPEPEEERFLHREILEAPEADAGRLLALVERALPPLFARMEERGRAAAEILLSLRAADGTRTGERLRPGTPTLDPAAALELLRLRIEALRLRSGVEEMAIEAVPVPLQRRQGRLFREEKGRDRAPAARAFARLRAEFGAGTVVRAALRDAHLPEASFSWEPLEALRAPRPGPGRPVLVRRVLDRPVPLPHRSPHEPDGWIVDDPRMGSVTVHRGPFVVSGGWWAREVHREYHYLETRRGDLLWVFHDRRRRRWFLHGRVE